MSHVNKDSRSAKVLLLNLRRSSALGPGFCLLGVLLVLGTINSKILGAAWLGFCIWGFWVAFRTRNTPINPDAVLATSSTASVWLYSCIAALALAITSTLIWPENAEALNAYFRLLLPAAAALILLRRGGLSIRARNNIFHVIALACIVAFAWTVFWAIRGADVRGLLATNAIPWAVAISFYPCLLIPIALSENQSTFKRRFWIFAAACGIGAVILSQSRGAFLVLLWCGVVYAWFWHHHKYSSRVGFHRTLLLLSCVLSLLIASAWWMPGDVLRIRQAVQNIAEFQTKENYNTSVGARLYLWEMASKGIQQSPLIGIGGTERLHRIKHAGDGKSEAELANLSEVRTLGHVHNQYLHSAWDGGMIGLGAFIVLLAGILIATRQLSRIDAVAAWQLGGILFMHATSNMTNVNFAHNYYALALSLAAVIPILCARSDRASP